MLDPNQQFSSDCILEQYASLNEINWTEELCREGEEEIPDENKSEDYE